MNPPAIRDIRVPCPPSDPRDPRPVTNEMREIRVPAPQPDQRSAQRCYDPRMPWELRILQQRLEGLSNQQVEAWTPAIDVYETGSSFVVTAELPGVNREQVDLAFEDRRLTIRGHRSDRAPGRETSCTSIRSNGAMARSRARSSSRTRLTSSK